MHGAIFCKRGACELVSPWVPYCTHHLVSWCLHLAAATDHSGIHIPFDLLQKAALYAPVADYLFDFDSQGLITVRSFTTSSPWMSVGSCFSNCLDVFLAFSVIYSKFYLEIMANLVPVGQLTVAQAHQEFTKLVDQISAKFVQLDSGKFGAVGTRPLMPKCAS